MKTIEYNKYGPPEVLHIVEREKPTPKGNELLVKLHAVAVTAADSRLRGARFPAGFGVVARLIFGVFRPRNKVLGGCFSGVVEAVGEEVGSFKVGDEVFGMLGFGMGGYAEYIKVKENKAVILKPKKVSHNEASGLTFGGTTALYYLRDLAKVKKGQKVLVNGASGAVGTNAVQLAKYFGAEVTGVCGTENIELVRSLGAEHVIDYKKESALDSKEKYDLIVECVGNLPIKEAKKLLTEEGKLALVVGTLLDNIKPDKKILAGTASEKKEDIEFLMGLVEQGKLKVVIERAYKFEQVVEAHRRADSGQKVGNVVLKVIDFI